MSVRVENKDLLDSLSLDEMSTNFTDFDASWRKKMLLKAPTFGTTQQEREREENKRQRIQRHDDYKKKSNHLLLRTSKNYENKIARDAQREEEEFQRNIKSVRNGHQLANEIGKTLAITDEANHNKNRRQFEEWESNVHDRIQSEILNQINSRSYQEINQGRCDDFQKFLDISNAKASLFRDIIIESEYDPLEPNRRSIKARTGLLKDPVKKSLQKAKDESNMVTTTSSSNQPPPSSSSDPLSSIRHTLNLSKTRQSGLSSTEAVTREVLNVEEWATGKIESTPHGVFSKMMSQEPPDEPNNTYTSDLPFDHYKIARGMEVVMGELPKGKRVFAIKDSNPISWNDQYKKED